MKNQGRFWSILFVAGFVMAMGSQAFAEIKKQYVAGEYIVKMRSWAGSQALGQPGVMMAGSNARVKSVVSQKMNTVVVSKSIIETPEAALAELNNNPMVEFAEPNYMYYANAQPNDLRLDDLWGLINKLKSSGGVDIDAEAAWDITTGDRKIVVAVIDTGVDYTNPDLKNNMWKNQAEANGQPGVDDDGNGYVDDIYGYDFANKDGDPLDDNDHGSHCAGTIGAEGDNGLGVVGVNWRVSIMALKFLTASGGGSLEDALKAIDYATDKGVNVMSNSWGGGGESQALREAIERAEQAGILFVAAAGNASNNNDTTPSFPASYDVPNVISVAAVDNKGNLASFSNYGKSSVHVAAPGVDILSTGKSGLIKLSGTSMATPHVSGVAALMLAADSGLSYQTIKQRLLATSVPLPSLRNKVSHGMLNAYNAITNTLPPPDVNDPSNWPSQAESVSTPHPYPDNFDQSYTVTVPGAQKVAVHFSNFQTERGYDKVEFYDGGGQLLGEMTGDNADSFSPVASGDTIVVRIISDYSVTGFGFDIDRVHYQSAPRDEWSRFEDPVSTSHPYANFIDQEVVFEAPGASEMKVKFGRFETERRYDFVFFYDSEGNEIGRWDGIHDGEFSPTAKGDKLVVRLKTDFSVRRYGFDVEEVYYR